MNVTYTGGTTHQRALVSRTLELIEQNGYPLDGLEIAVDVSWPAEPSAPGHKEFACATTDSPGVARIEIRDALDTWDNEPWTGEDFYMESVAHEVGHVIASFLLNDARRTEMAALFRRKGPPGYPGPEGAFEDWAAGTWRDRIEEAVAETFKDTWLTPDQRKFDNRTNWELSQANFRPFLELMGITGANGGGGSVGTPDQEVTLGAPLIAGAGNRGLVLGDGAQPQFWSYDTNQGGGSGYDFTSALPGGGGSTSPVQNHMLLPEHVTHLQVDLDLSMVPDWASADVSLATDYYGDLAGVQYVGWGAGQWQNWRRNLQFSYYESGAGTFDFLLAWTGPDGFEPVLALDLAATPQTPEFHGLVAVPPRDGYPRELFFSVTGSSPGPSGPGVPQNWHTRSWTAKYTIPGTPPESVEPLADHLIPDFPYAGDGSGTMGVSGPTTVRRGRSAGRRRRPGVA